MNWRFVLSDVRWLCYWTKAYFIRTLISRRYEKVRLMFSTCWFSNPKLSIYRLDFFRQGLRRDFLSLMICCMFDQLFLHIIDGKNAVRLLLPFIILLKIGHYNVCSRPNYLALRFFLLCLPDRLHNYKSG